jgi:transposase
MDQLIERCAGLDVHKKTVAACLRVPGPQGQRRQQTRTFTGHDRRAVGAA